MNTNCTYKHSNNGPQDRLTKHRGRCGSHRPEEGPSDRYLPAVPESPLNTHFLGLFTLSREV